MTDCDVCAGLCCGLADAQMKRAQEKHERLLAAVRDAHGYLSGEFYNEALGILEDALVQNYAPNQGVNSDG